MNTYSKLPDYCTVEELGYIDKELMNHTGGKCPSCTKELRFIYKTILNGDEFDVYHCSSCECRKTILMKDSNPLFVVKNFKNLTNKNTPSRLNRGYVYLVQDEYHPYTKIGFSSRPKIRERTLQAERPTLEMVWKCEATMDQENDLHLIFHEKRKRGEWFLLSVEDIEYIKSEQWKDAI